MKFVINLLVFFSFAGVLASEVFQLKSSDQNLTIVLNGSSMPIEGVVKNYSSLISKIDNPATKRLISWYYYRSEKKYDKFISLYSPEERGLYKEHFSKSDFVEQFSKGVSLRTKITIDYSFVYDNMMAFRVTDYIGKDRKKKYLVMMENIDGEGWCFTNKYVAEPLYPLFNSLLIDSVPEMFSASEGNLLQFKLTDGNSGRQPYLLWKVASDIPEPLSNLVFKYANSKDNEKLNYWDKQYYPPNLTEWNYLEGFGKESSIISFVEYQGQKLVFCRLKSGNEDKNILINVSSGKDDRPLFSLNNFRDPFVDFLRNKIKPITSTGLKAKPEVVLPIIDYKYTKPLIVSVQSGNTNKSYTNVTFRLEVSITTLPDEKMSLSELELTLKQKGYFSLLDRIYPFFKDKVHKELQKKTKEELLKEGEIGEIEKLLLINFNNTLKTYQQSPRLINVKFIGVQWSN